MNPFVREKACGCDESRPAVRRSAFARAPRGLVRESHRALRSNIAPVEVRGERDSKCKPFIKIEKDPEAFAACNALADEIGPLDDPKNAVPFIIDICGDDVNETFGILMLDIHCRFKGSAETGRGEPDSVMAPIGPTFQVAVANGAHAIILWHNHPSGIEARPSKADEETTKAFVEAGEVLGIHVLDHIVIGGSARKPSFYSFLEDGKI